MTLIALIAASVLNVAPEANARGCIKGAIAGGVAGHYAGRHTYVGALGGCLVGRRLAKEKDARNRAAAQAAQSQQYQSPPVQPYSGGTYTRSSAPAQTSAPAYTGGAYKGSAAPAQTDTAVPAYTGGAYRR